jgi:hypothetical protein
MHIMPTQSVPWPLLLHWPCNRTHTALLLAGSTTHNGPLILNPSAVTTQADRIALIQPAFSIISWDVCPWGRIEEGNLTLWGCVFVSGRENKLRGAFQAIQEYGDLCIGEMVSWAYKVGYSQMKSNFLWQGYNMTNMNGISQNHNSYSGMIPIIIWTINTY